MMGHPSHHREDSSSSKSHRPAQPSSLRQSHAASSRDSSQDSGPAFRHAVPSRDDAARGDATVGGNTDESTPLISDGGSTERRRSSAVHPGVCNHGTFSPRPMTPDEVFPIARDDIVTTGPDGLFDNSSSQASIEEGWKKWFSGRIRTKRMGETRELAHRAGFRDTPLM